jgi:hypothetical protein
MGRQTSSGGQQLEAQGRGPKSQGGLHDPTKGGGRDQQFPIKWTSICTSDATIKRELDWQARVGGDATKATTFRDQVLNQQAFRVFAFMKGKLLATRGDPRGHPQ